MLLIYLLIPSIIYQFDKCEPKNMLCEWKTSCLDLVVYTATGVSICLSRILHFCKSNLHSNWQLEYMYFNLSDTISEFLLFSISNFFLDFLLTKLKNHINKKHPTIKHFRPKQSFYDFQIKSYIFNILLNSSFYIKFKGFCN